jgi:hypothetical protein
MLNRTNFGYSVVSVPPVPPTSGNQLTVNPGDGALFPVPCSCTVWPANQRALVTNAEIVLVTNVVGDTLFITRAQEGSTAQPIAAGYQIAETLTAGMWNTTFEPYLGVPAVDGYVLSSTVTGARSWVPTAGGGTVTRIDTGAGLTGGPITGSGTIAVTPRLAAVDALPDAPGWEHNDGAGNLSWSTPTKAEVGLGSVIDAPQTLASVLPNLQPLPAQIPVADGSGTYQPQTVRGDGTISSDGTLWVSSTHGLSFARSAVVDTTDASNIDSGILPSTRLPTPTPSSLGALYSGTVAPHRFVTGVGTDGILASEQPSTGDISDLSTWPGSTAITTVGTIATGAWNANPIPWPKVSKTGALPSDVGATDALVVPSTPPLPGQILVGGLAGSYQPQAVYGDASLANNGTLTVTPAAITLAKMADLAASSVIGNDTAAPATPFPLSTSQVLDMVGTMTGDLLFRDIGNWQALVGNTTPTQKFLSQTGNGTVSAAPSWQVVPSAGVLSYYLQDAASDVAGYKKQLATPQATTNTLSISGLSSGSVLQNWVTDPGIPNLQYIPAGQFEFHIHARKTGGSKAAGLYCEIWECSAAGADIELIGTTEITPNLSGTVTEYRVYFTTANVYNLAATTSRIVARVVASVSGAGTAPTVELSYGGEADSHIALPSSTVDATNFVPYTGATKDVDLGAHALSLGGDLTLTGLTASTAVYADGSKRLVSLANSTGWLHNDGSGVLGWSAIVPNTAPSAGQVLVGNAGGTAYAPQTVSGSGATVSLSSAGVLTISAVANASLSNSAITIAGTSTSLGGSISQDTITGLSSTGLVKRTAANTLGIASAGSDYVAPGVATGSGLTVSASPRLLGRTTAGAGAIEEVSAGNSLSLSSGALDAIQDIRTTATPTFAGATLNGAVTIRSGNTLNFKNPDNTNYSSIKDSGATGLTALGFYVSGASPDLLISPSGYVGIGTVAPHSLLSINVGDDASLGSDAHIGLRLQGGGYNTDIQQIGFGYTSAGLTYAPAVIAGITTDGTGYTAAGLIFATRSATTDTAPVERLRIASSGNVSIGTGYLAVGAYAGSAVNPGDVIARRSATAGAYYFGDGGSAYLYFDGTNYVLGNNGSSAGLSLTGNVYVTANPGTASVQYRVSNTGGTLYLGMDSSTGGTFGTAYAAAIWNGANSPLLFATNGVQRMSIDTSGAVAITSSGSLRLYGYSASTASSVIWFDNGSNNYLYNSGASGGLWYFRVAGNDRLVINGAAATYIYSIAGQSALVTYGADNSFTNQTIGSSTTGQSYGAYIQAGTNSSDTSLLVVNYGATATYLKVRGDGNVGIGIASPNYPLSLGSATGNKIALYDSGAGTIYGFGIQASLLQIFGHTTTSDIAFGYGDSASFTELMRIKGTGLVGIGVNPSYPLHVLGDNIAQRIQKKTNATGNIYLDFADYNGTETGYVGHGTGANWDLYVAQLTAASKLIFYNGGNALVIASTGAITFNSAYTFPTTDGTAGYFLKTNGSGTLSWATAGGTGTVTSVATGTGLTGGTITTSGTISVTGILSTFVGLANAAGDLKNDGSGGLSYRAFTVSASTPSGTPANGDLWLQYV